MAHPPILSTLATELLTRIFLGLKVGDLTRCKRVCRRFNELIATDLSLQYHMELDIAGMVDGHAGAPDLPVRLEKLRARNEEWEMGLLLHTVMLQSPNIPTLVWHCTGGFLLYEEGTTAEDLRLKLHRPAYPHMRSSGGLQERSKMLTAWKSSIPTLSQIRSCSVNPEEDMVVITKNTGHMEIPSCVVLSISLDSTPHPMAAKSAYFASRARAVGCHDRIESVGDLISWTIHPTEHSTGGLSEVEDSEMLVINWKSGATVWRCISKSFAKCLLLDQYHVLVMDEQCFYVHQFNPQSSSASTSARNDCSILFSLPDLATGMHVAELQCYASGPRYFRDDRTIFQEDPDLAVLVVYMRTERPPSNTKHVVFIIPIRDILAEARLEDRPQTPPRRASEDSIGPGKNR